MILLKQLYLDRSFLVLMSIQQILSFSGTENLSFSASFQQVYSYVALLLFDYQFIHVGCIYGYISFTVVFFGSVIVIATIYIYFFLCAMMYQYIRQNDTVDDNDDVIPILKPKQIEQELTENPLSRPSSSFSDDRSKSVFDRTSESGERVSNVYKTSTTSTTVSSGDEPSKFILTQPTSSSLSSLSSPSNQFHWLYNSRTPRLVRSITLAYYSTYVLFCQRIFEALYCSTSVLNDNTYRLVREPGQVCYQGAHLYVAITAWLILFFYLLYAPYKFFRFLQANKQSMYLPLFQSRYGFLYRDSLPRFYWFRLSDFLFGLALGIQNVFVTQTVVITVVFGFLCFGIDTAFVLLVSGSTFSFD